MDNAPNSAEVINPGMAPNLNRLRSFIAVAQERQFRRAAERIGISQPALSAHIRELEQDLGVALFSRTTRSVRLTSEGESFLHRAQRVLDDLNAAVLEIRERAQLKHGRVVMAATPTVASQILPPLIASFTLRFAGVRVQVLEAIASEVERLVASGQADFGVGPRPQGRTELAFRFLLRERLCGVLPIGHELAERRRVRLAELARYSLLTTVPGSAIYDSIERVLRERAMKISIDHVLTQHQTAIAMAAAGLGVALVPERMLTTADRRRIRVVAVSDPEVTGDIGILQRKGGAASSAADEFLKLLISDELASATRKVPHRRTRDGR
jgi:LysR family transcriptional regulator, carnitine catabolism transcriptional activator